MIKLLVKFRRNGERMWAQVISNPKIFPITAILDNHPFTEMNADIKFGDEIEIKENQVTEWDARNVIDSTKL